jgi:hypothetical protein
MPHRFFRPDKNLEKKSLPERTESFFMTLEKEYGCIIFDEISILHRAGNDYQMLYYQSYEGMSTDKKRASKIERFMSRMFGTEGEGGITHDVEFFVERILKRGILADHEGVFDRNREGKVFDAMVRIGDYFLCFNNTEQSIRSLEERYSVPQGAIIKRIREYCALFERT